MSKSYRAAAADAFDDNEREHLMAESQRYLEKFIKEKPDHPEAVAAMAEWASFLTRRALQLITPGKNVESNRQGPIRQPIWPTPAPAWPTRGGTSKQAQKRFKVGLPSCRRRSRRQEDVARRCRGQRARAGRSEPARGPIPVGLARLLRSPNLPRSQGRRSHRRA